VTAYRRWCVGKIKLAAEKEDLVSIMIHNKLFSIVIF